MNLTEACVEATERHGAAKSDTPSNSGGDARRLIFEEGRGHGVERRPGCECFGRRRKLAVVLAQSIARRRPIPRGHRSVDCADLVSRGRNYRRLFADDRANVIGEGKRQEIYKLRDETHHDDGPGDKPNRVGEKAAEIIAMAKCPTGVEFHDERKHVQRDDNWQ